MPQLTVGTENSGAIELYYEDHGAGPPVVLIHGYPLSGRAWDKQVPALLEELDLRHAILVGHSMGTGEVTRYLGTYGSGRVSRAVLISPIPPFLLQAGDNPEGLPASLFDGFVAAAREDSPAFLKEFLDRFYNMDVLGGTLVSDQAFQASFELATAMSATAAVACIPTWATDFRADLARIDVPMLVLDGDADRVLPYDKTGGRLPGLIRDLELVTIKGGPHAIAWTHTDQVNDALLSFLR